ncbi:hypothetical protein C5167_011579 [Papaver somniferum]|uniref:Uncharacterized protein n=1 Tax=Papaver somniferum TaxID=3469 RepID=A0A4Y7K4P8_PAPSO|nr:hypothetical protein C5167_011579 [Papaver somniferum]
MYTCPFFLINRGMPNFAAASVVQAKNISATTKSGRYSSKSFSNGCWSMPTAKKNLGIMSGEASWVTLSVPSGNPTSTAGNGIV